MTYRVLLKASRSVTNGDGSLRYDVGDLLPEGHRDLAVQTAVFVPTVFEEVDGGLVDTSERTRPLVSDDKILGPRTVWAEKNTHGLWGPVTAKPPKAKKDQEPGHVKPPEPPEPAAEAKDTHPPVPAKEPETVHKTATLGDGGSGVEDTGQRTSSKGRHS